MGGDRFTPRLHQIALIADNRRDELKTTLGSYSYDVSHLCHNRKCFNPEHLIVESRTNNQRRRICNGHKILVHDGFSYHPCAHGSVEKMRKCILPVQHLQDIMPNSNEQTSTEATPAPDLGDIATTSGGYCRVRLRKLHARPMVHQLALIATHRGDELKWTLGKRSYYTGSHLCHNHQCFNPQHLIVESNSDYMKRKACKGKTIVVRGIY
ncbi:zinc-binding loop region of homing endonuclease [Lipomyces starkeyi]